MLKNLLTGSAMVGSAQEVIGTAAEGIDISKFSWEGLIRVVLLVVIGVVVIKVVQGLLSKLLAGSKVPQTAHRFVLTGVKALMWVILALVILGSIGAEVTSIIALLSVAGLAVSMALQDTLSNMAGGIVLLIVRPFQVGHYISADGMEGVVQALSLSYTTLVTVDAREVIIPNSQLASAKIVNFTSLGKRRVDLQFTASYDDSTEDVIAALKDAISQEPRVWDDPEPFVHLKEYQSSAILYEIRVWTSSADYWDVYFSLLEKVRPAFDRHGVHMTYDHVMVHMLKE